MLAHCANSSCRVAFDYRLGGAFFRFTKRGIELQPSQQTPSANRTHDVQHFWLCGQCSKTHTLIWSGRSRDPTPSGCSRGFRGNLCNKGVRGVGVDCCLKSSLSMCGMPS